MPVYLELCMQTWRKAIPGVQISMIDHRNIQQFVPKTLLTDSFFKLPLAMQSDVVSVWVLLSRGGLFIDADTIMTANPFASMALDDTRLHAFGYPQQRRIHLAIMLNQQPHNALLYAWITDIAQKMAQPLPSPLPWDWVGNAIINPLLNDPSQAERFHILDAGEYGNILELSVADDNPCHRYLKYYFTPPGESIEEIVGKVKGGMISLHNSWTPEIYRAATLQEIINSRESLMLSYLLVTLLAA